MAEPVLRLAGLTKRFGALVATDDVWFDLRARECHALIGPNGAGKTTLVQQVSGLVRPDLGHIHFAGQDITRLAPHRRAALGLGRTFQTTSIVPGATALANVALAVQARSGSSFRFVASARDDAALDREAFGALERIGLAERARQPASSLAHGEKRALELAMALAMAPKLLLLDEPMAGVGRDESQVLLAILRDLKATLPMLLIEHDMDAV
ncbi:MAG: ABC transporter ATP-binding protein, partial [Pseudomonadota bacterium]